MSSSNKSVYLVAQFDVKDLEDFIQRYAIGVIGQLQKVGAEILAAAAPQIVEGNVDVNRTVVIRFPSMKVAKTWYDSEEYQPFRELRKSELTNSGSAMFVEAFDSSV